MTRIKQPEKVRALLEIPLFSGLSKKELDSLARLTTEISVNDGQTLVKQGQLGKEAMIIMSGTAVVRRNGRKIDEMGPGDFFGEMSLIDDMPRNADVIASSDMTLLLMDSKEFSTIFDQYPKVAVKILKVVVERLLRVKAATI